MTPTTPGILFSFILIALILDIPFLHSEALAKKGGVARLGPSVAGHVLLNLAAHGQIDPVFAQGVLDLRYLHFARHDAPFG